jgi:AraC-like DNA-binding protein
VFQLTPQQALTKLRIEAAMRLLQGCDSVADIGLACGFTDQSAFARQFKATVGMTPREYRGLSAVAKS